MQQVAFPRGTSELFATCALNDIRVWQTATSKEALRITVPGKVGLLAAPAHLFLTQPHSPSLSIHLMCQECHCIAFHPDGKSIVSGWDDGIVRSFTPQTGKLMFQIANAQSKVRLSAP